MIKIKSNSELLYMREAGKISAGARALAGRLIKAGTSTKEIDIRVKEFIEKHNARPNFLGYNGFPASLCVSLNHEVIHGIPSDKVILRDGDIVKIDVGACYKGYHGDCADTFFCGDESAMPSSVKKLIEVTRTAFFKGAEQAVSSGRIGDIGAAVGGFVESEGFSVVRQYIGHGIGSAMHEEPDVPNFGLPGKGPRLREGMTIAVEPMVNVGEYAVKVENDGWTVVTADGKLSAHYENTILITANGNEILTVD